MKGQKQISTDIYIYTKQHTVFPYIFTSGRGLANENDKEMTYVTPKDG